MGLNITDDLDICISYELSIATSGYSDRYVVCDPYTTIQFNGATVHASANHYELAKVLQAFDSENREIPFYMNFIYSIPTETFVVLKRKNSIKTVETTNDRLVAGIAVIADQSEKYTDEAMKRFKSIYKTLTKEEKLFITTSLKKINEENAKCGRPVTAIINVIKYSYNFNRLGLTLTDNETGKTVFLQDDEANELYDELDNASAQSQQDIISEYFAD